MSTHLRWPADRFYWSVLDAPLWKRTGLLPAGLRPVFEDDVPVDGQDLHAVCTPLEDGRLVVCAACRDELEALGADVLSLCPESAPGCINGSLDPAALNLLVGELEPAVQRGARVRGHLVRAAGLVLCSLVAAFGLTRRAENQRELANEARAATMVLLNQVVPQGRPETLGFELASLRRSAEIGQRIEPPKDATPALVELLRGWPADVQSRPQSLSVSANTINLAVLVDGDPLPFLDALPAPHGWIRDQPRLNKVDQASRLDLRFRPSEGGRP
jgi:hypothetical protein